MFFSFEGQGNDAHFWIPLVLHGLGVGIIMVPTILFCITSVSPQLGASAAAVCLAIRYLGYTSSIGLQNFFKLFEYAQHQQVFRDQTEVGNPLFREYLQQESVSILQHGLQYKEHTAALKLVAERVKIQSFVRYAMDYYEIMSMISISILLLILISPSLKSMYKKLRKNRISPA